MEIEKQAQRIIESYCGQSFGIKQMNEQISLKQNRGKLTYGPIVNLIEVKVRAGEWAFSSFFGATEWKTIHLNDVVLEKKHLEVSGCFLDTYFTEADVTYKVGYVNLPESVRRALNLLVSHLKENGSNGSNYSLSAFITPEIADLLSPFHKVGGES